MKKPFILFLTLVNLTGVTFANGFNETCEEDAINYFAKTLNDVQYKRGLIPDTQAKLDSSTQSIEENMSHYETLYFQTEYYKLIMHTTSDRNDPDCRVVITHYYCGKKRANDSRNTEVRKCSIQEQLNEMMHLDIAAPIEGGFDLPTYVYGKLKSFFKSENKDEDK